MEKNKQNLLLEIKYSRGEKEKAGSQQIFQKY